MNLPPPFQDASGVEVDPEGRITLVNYKGVSIARLDLKSAYDLSTNDPEHWSGNGRYGDYLELCPSEYGSGVGGTGYSWSRSGIGQAYGDTVPDGSCEPV